MNLTIRLKTKSGKTPVISNFYRKLMNRYIVLRKAMRLPFLVFLRFTFADAGRNTYTRQINTIHRNYFFRFSTNIGNQKTSTINQPAQSRDEQKSITLNLLYPLLVNRTQVMTTGRIAKGVPTTANERTGLLPSIRTLPYRSPLAAHPLLQRQFAKEGTGLPSLRAEGMPDQTPEQPMLIGKESRIEKTLGHENLPALLTSGKFHDPLNPLSDPKLDGPPSHQEKESTKNHLRPGKFRGLQIPVPARQAPYLSATFFLGGEPGTLVNRKKAILNNRAILQLSTSFPASQPAENLAGRRFQKLTPEKDILVPSVTSANNQGYTPERLILRKSPKQESSSVQEPKSSQTRTDMTVTQQAPLIRQEPAHPSMRMNEVNAIADKVYKILEKRIALERERKGALRW